MGTENWSTVAGSNGVDTIAGAADYMPEGQNPSTVNDRVRSQMAGHRTQWNDAEWFQYGDGDGPCTYTYGSATTFTIAANVTTEYRAGRRIRAVGVSTGTIYGSIISSAYSAPNTTVTVAWDSGSLANETLTISLAIIRPSNRSVPLSFSLGASDNLFENPEFEIARRFTANTYTRADDQFGYDRWNVLTQTGNVTVDNSGANIPTGYRWNGRVTNAAGSAQRFGITQMKESLETFPLRGKPITAVGNVYCTTGFNLRYAWLAWTGTANAITSDVVNSWTSGTYTAGNFFLGSNLTVISVGVTTVSSSTWTNFSLTTTCPTNANNLIFMCWTEGTLNNAVSVDFTGFGAYQAASAPTYQSPNITLDRYRCSRYYWNNYRHNALVGAATFGGCAAAYTTVANETDHYDLIVSLPNMRTTPTMTVRSPNSGASGNLYNSTTAADVAVSSVSNTSYVSTGWPVTAAIVAAGNQIACFYEADAEL